MTVELRQATEADFPQMFALDARSFHLVPTEQDEAFAKQTLDFGRFVVGFDSDEMVAIAGSFEMELTLPGLARLPMAGVTWVGVSTTHRRRGLLRELMAWLDDAAIGADEPLMGLGASEGAIYGRFGYGPVNRRRVVAIDRVQARFKDPALSRAGSVRVTAAADAVGAMAARWDHYRQMVAGEVSRTENDVRNRVHQAGPGAVAAIHDDGFAMWKVTQGWTGGIPDGELDVLEFCAATPEAHADLWKTILSVDLVSTVRAGRAVTDHDLLDSLLVNPRAIITTSLFDNLWVKVLDPGRAFAARNYRIDDRLVVATDHGTFSVDPDSCTASEDEPDLRLEATAVGPLLLGGTSATDLAAADIARGAPDALARADAFFGHAPGPVTRIEF